MAILTVVLGLGVAWVLWWWVVRRHIPAHPPLVIDADDPDMVEAIRRGRATLDRFRRLVETGKGEGQVKVPFVTSAGDTEHLWAEVLALDGATVTVRYLTPPVSHLGRLERVHEHDVADIEDWAVATPAGDIHGGHTQRVMFARARERWGRLPSELEAQETRFID